MTTPGGIPNMPAAAMTVGQLGDRLQNLSSEKLRQRSGDQFANIFATSPGGNALDAASPFGIITSLFGGFMSTVANADPADLNGPEDLPGLLADFVEEIPVVGDIFSLMQAILGVYEGDNVTLKAVSDLFKLIWDTFDSVNEVIGGVLDFILGIANAILSAIRGVPVAGGQIADRIEDVLADMRGLNDTAHGASGLVAQVKSGIINGWAESGAAGSDSGVYNTMASIRALLATGSFTRVNVTSTMTWTKPAGVTGDVVIIGVAAGKTGNAGSSNSGDNGGDGGAGGLGGGHMVKVINADDFTALHVTIGTNGATTEFRRNTSGGDGLMAVSNGLSGSVATSYGYTPTASAAGDGGAGGLGTSWNSFTGADTRASTNGTTGRPASAFSAKGGTGGTRSVNGAGLQAGHGSAGGAVDVADLIPCGGGGGGGGGGAGRGVGTGAKNHAGNGGAGGFPGGGGGGGGGGAPFPLGGGSNPGTGGAGAAGLGIIYYKAAT